MITKPAAVYQFLSSFNMPVYTSSSVPDGAEITYITYDYIDGAFDTGTQTMPVVLWFNTNSEKIPNAKVHEISQAIGLGGKTIPCEDGFIWIKKGTPFAQVSNDTEIKSRYLLLDIDYFTEF